MDRRLTRTPKVTTVKRLSNRAAAAGSLPSKSPDFTVIFDGGSRGNPGPGYGSFVLVRNADGAERRQRLTLGNRMTSNEAEYDTLIRALEALLAWIRDSGLRPEDVSVEVRGDSRLVILQVRGDWKARNARMAARRDRVLALARRLGTVRWEHQPRFASLRILGH